MTFTLLQEKMYDDVVIAQRQLYNLFDDYHFQMKIYWDMYLVDHVFFYRHAEQHWPQFKNGWKSLKPEEIPQRRFFLTITIYVSG